jgi:TonB family protein
MSPLRWREEIHFANYSRLRVRDAKGYWQESGVAYQPEVIFQLDTLLQLKRMLRLQSKETLGKVRSIDKKGIRQKCTEARWAQGTDRTLCFDDVSGVLVSVEYPQHENQNPPEVSRIEYGEFKTVAKNLIPYEARALHDRKVIVAIKVQEIEKVTEEDATLFNPPEEAELWNQCDDVQDAELTNRVQPIYPPSARANHEAGRVILYAVIEADGSVSHITVVQRAARQLEAAAVDAVRQWHYKPAMCGQTPIRLETNIEIDFSLRY